MEHDNVTTNELNNALQTMSNGLSPAAQQQFGQLMQGAREYFLERDTGGFEDGPRVDFVNGIQWGTLINTPSTDIVGTRELESR